jgi:DNA-binding response OmpR family regulator
LMDIRMPDMNGFEALKKIRRQGGGAAVPVIALTASGMKEDVIRIQEAGFDDLLIRPFDQVALLELLACYLPRADSDKGAFESERESLASDVVLEQLPLWTCPPAARDRLFNTLRHQWRQAQKKQSVPEIVAFAKAVAAIGDQYDISIISRYGSELAGYADAFDIHQMEKLLANYEKVLDRWIAPAP